MQKTTKTLTLQPGRWRVRFVCADAGGNLSVTVDEPKSLFTHTRERAQKAYDAHHGAGAEGVRAGGGEGL